jgi:hypothetical protein
MTDGMSGHPKAETMAAFVEGTLTKSELASMTEHLRDCDDCRTVAAETARFTEEEEAEAPHGTPWWIWAAAMVAALALGILFLRPSSPMDRLIAAAPKEHRSVGARLSGFHWARLQPPARGAATPDPADLKLAGAAGDVLEKTAGDARAEASHAAGVAYLLIGSGNESIAALERAAKGSKDARAWSDLAAARYAVALRQDKPSLLAQALADADQALRLEPKLPEGLFNQALIVEALGAREQARVAWLRYLEVDPSSGWAIEAREHLRRLAPSTAADSPRARAEGLMLAEWADGKQELAPIRAIAAALAANGEHLLEDAVDAINDDTRETIAAGQRTYRDGRLAYRDLDFADAERLFRLAAEQFRAGGSAMEEVASYYAASAAMNQNRGADELRALLGRIDEKRHRALGAQIRWMLAIDANALGDYPGAVREADAAAETFRTLGERTNAGLVDSIAAHALERMGESDAAWRRRIRAFEAHCCGADQRCNNLLLDAATTLASVDRTAAAVAMIDIAIDTRGAEPADLALWLASRAAVANRAEDAELVRRSLAAARQASAHIADPAVRELAEAQIGIEGAVLQRTSDPRAAVAALGRAQAFFQSHRLAHMLPYIHLQKARALRAAGDGNAAVAEYAAALGESGEPMDDTAAQAIDESIALLLARGEVPAALEVADRRHRLNGGKTVQPVRNAPAGRVILEYAVLPHALVTFCISGSEVEVKTIAIDRGALAEQIEAFNDQLRRRAPLEPESAALYRLLIKPFEQRLSTELVIVPDGRLYALPFAALYDEATSRYLIEQTVVRMAPAATGAGAEAPNALTPALVVADPPAGDQPPLRASREEAAHIAALHGATLLAGEAATRERFAALAPQSALIHYAGHGDSALLLSSGLARLRLARQPLVVLAACGTFRGETAHVAGMSSLARAFLLAGARGVVGTLWEVDDDVAATLSLHLHANLHAGASPARALREAQLDLLRSPDARLAHPAAWAPFELFSNL